MDRKSFLRLIYSLLPLLGGCALEPRYDVRIVHPNKDVVLMLVYVPGKLNVSVYRRIAENEIRRLLDLRTQAEPPLYEARFEFLTLSPQTGEAQKVAALTWKVESPNWEPSVRPEESAVVLY